MKNNSYNKFFMNFANRGRFDIIMALREKPMSVSDIVKKVGGEQSGVSHNLKKLSCCHILNVRKDGKQRIYSLNNETVTPMLRIVESHVKRNCVMGRCGNEL